MKLYKTLYFWVLIFIFIGILLGSFAPEFAVKLKPIADAFIKLIKMLIAPIVFCSITLALASNGNSKSLLKLSAKTLLYFEIVSTLALIFGLAVMNFWPIGKNLHFDLQSFDQDTALNYSNKSGDLSVVDFILNIIPTGIFDGFTSSGNLLQILLVAVLFGVALNNFGKKSEQLLDLLDLCLKCLFKIVDMIMYLAPLAAGSAIGFAIGKYGFGSLSTLLGFMLLFYATCLVFIFLVLGIIAKITGYNIFNFLGYIKTELLTVLGTSSSESALPNLMEKLEKLGAEKSIVGIVIPAGYSFNLDGTNIYLSMAVLFLAQIANIDLNIWQQLSILLVAMLTSKGAAGVTGSGFITLAATIAIIPDFPMATLAVILGIDRFMSEARALTNLVGNGVATLFVSKWEGRLDFDKLNKELKN